MTQSEQINELAAALAKAQGSMANATMNRTNPHFKSKYADLSSVLDAIRAPLSASGLSVVQTMQVTERGLVLRTTLMHASGQFISTEYPLPSTQRPHEMGSALTYARRYSLAALVCNSADEDDDGNMAMDSKPSQKPANANASARIGAKDLQELRDLIDRKETDVERVCKHFKLTSLADITPEQLPTILAAVKGKPDRKYPEAAE
jgi:hypothetical protein